MQAGGLAQQMKVRYLNKYRRKKLSGCKPGQFFDYIGKYILYKKCDA